MDSGLGSDEDRRSRTKEQKQRHNQQLLTACFIDSANNPDDPAGEDVVRRNQERRQGALLFQTSIPQYSMMHMPEHTPPDTPYNSIVHLEDDETSSEAPHKAPLGFYVDLSEVQEPEPVPPPTTSAKKNIFSMVIDFQAPKKDMPNRLRRSRLGSSTSSNNSDVKESNGVKENGCDINGQPALVDNGRDNNIVIDNTCIVPVNDKSDEESSPRKETLENGTSVSEEKHSTTESESSTKQFVKLSDLERQSPIVDLTILPRMTRSIPESSWVEEPLLMSRSMGYRSVPKPLPPEPSELTDSCESETGNCQRRLGTDLLRMFLEEIRPDVSVKVAGRTIRAHRCILVSRCQYFAGSLSGHHDDVIQLRGFTFEAVHFAMCHIYSGAAHVPDSISLEELAALADLLGLEGLKEVVAHSLKTRHCHNFHKPCPGCLTGIPEVLPLAAAHGLDELYLRCLQWLMIHYERAWQCRAFASLPRELRDKCLQQHLIHMTADTVLGTLLSCDRLLASLPQLRWADPVVQLGLQLADAGQLFLRQHLTVVLSSSSFDALDADEMQRLEEPLLAAAEALGPEQACRSYGRCHKMAEQTWRSAHHLDLLRKLNRHLEQGLAARADKATRCPAWQRLEPALRARVREAARPSRLPRASSSDSSRTSSPATSRAPAGSPSLRRSLLLAARAPQIPASPSTTRRAASSLTRPTQSSAAKTTPSRNLRSGQVKSPTLTAREPVKNKNVSKKEPPKPVKSSTTKANRVSTPTVARRAAALLREDCKSPSSLCKSPSKTSMCKSPTKNSVLKSPSKAAASKATTITMPVCKSPTKAPLCKSPSKIINRSSVKSAGYRSPPKTAGRKSPSRPSTGKSLPKTVVCKSPPKTAVSKSPPKTAVCKSPTKTGVSGMTRSGTFLKDEPTVLARAH